MAPWSEQGCGKTGTHHDISCFSDFEHFVEMNILKPLNFGIIEILFSPYAKWG